MINRSGLGMYERVLLDDDNTSVIVSKSSFLFIRIYFRTESILRALWKPYLRIKSISVQARLRFGFNLLDGHC